MRMPREQSRPYACRYDVAPLRVITTISNISGNTGDEYAGDHNIIRIYTRVYYAILARARPGTARALRPFGFASARVADAADTDYRRRFSSSTTDVFRRCLPAPMSRPYRRLRRPDAAVVHFIFCPRAAACQLLPRRRSRRCRFCSLMVAAFAMPRLISSLRFVRCGVEVCACGAKRRDEAPLMMDGFDAAPSRCRDTPRAICDAPIAADEGFTRHTYHNAHRYMSMLIYFTFRRHAFSLLMMISLRRRCCLSVISLLSPPYARFSICCHYADDYAATFTTASRAMRRRAMARVSSRTPRSCCAPRSENERARAARQYTIILMMSCCCLPRARRYASGRG